MGRIPKPAATRQRRNKTTSAAQIDAAPATRRELADLMPEAAFHRMTVWSWDVWWSSPLAREWVDADVPDLVKLARLVDTFWTAKPIEQPKIHAEIRMAMREFGLTPMSRRSLQWEIRKLEQPAAPEQAPTPSRARDPRLRAIS